MRMISGLFVFLVLTGAIRGAAPALENWQLIGRGTFEARLADVLGPYVFLVGKQASLLPLISDVDADGQARIADFLEARGTAPGLLSTSTSVVAKSLRGRLFVPEGKKLVAFDPGTRPEPLFYLIYFSAHWCGPCRRFTPSLVQNYHRLKAVAPDVFEVIFMSSDESISDQVKYAAEAAMPWPMVKTNQRDSVAPLARLAGNGIPCLVVCTRSGDAVFHSYEKGGYVGPAKPLEQFERMLGALDERVVKLSATRFGVDVLLHVRAAGASPAEAKPYRTTIDPSSYQTLPFRRFIALLEIDEKGHVLSTETEPELPLILAQRFKRDTADWLFLPAVEEGRPRACRVRLPIDL